MTESKTKPDLRYSDGVTSLDKIVSEITKRGNDAEIRTCKDGIKVIEVSRKVAAVLPRERT